MREISIAENLTVEEYLEVAQPYIKRVVEDIRKEKAENLRPNPSAKLIDKSAILSEKTRASILDKIASLVDENLTGRSDMCEQFADLLTLSLVHLGFDARSASGEAIYYDEKRNELFRWNHFWVRSGSDIIDGNVDSIYENPMVPETVKVDPYWGPTNQVPSDRFFREDKDHTANPDNDVLNVWWPDLLAWLETVEKE